MQLEQLYQTYRPLLFGLAYRMLGSVTDAEDIVQDVFLKLHHQEMDKIDHMKAYLVKITTNRCLNHLQSSRYQREKYIGPWLPEPLLDQRENEPAMIMEKHENVSYAFLVLIQHLTPVERVVFLLREVFGFEYQTIAEILDKKEANCRKIYSRAKHKLQQETEPTQYQGQKTDHLVYAFIRAASTGNFQPFLRLLLEDASVITDGGGKVRSAINPILGRKRVVAFFEGIAVKGAFRGDFLPLTLNGETGLLLVREGKTSLAICFKLDPNGCRIQHIYIVLNPDKLKHLQI